MANRLANTIFQGLPTDNLLTKDVYGINTSVMQNKLFEAVKGVFTEAIDSLQTALGVPDDLVNLVADIASGSLSGQALLDRGLAYFGTSTTSLYQQSSDTLKATISQVLSSSGVSTSSVSGSISSAFDNFKNVLSGNYSDISSLLSTVSSITGVSSIGNVVDLGAQAATLGSISSVLTQYGYTDMVNTVADSASTPEVRTVVFKSTVPSALASGNLAAVNNILSNISVSDVQSVDPNAATTLLKSYTFPTDYVPTQAETQRAALVTAIETLGSTTDTFSGETVANLTAYSQASTDAQTLLLMAEPERTRVLSGMLLDTYSSADVVNQLYAEAYFT